MEMKVEVVLDAACTEPELTLRTAVVTGEVEQLLRRLSGRGGWKCWTRTPWCGGTPRRAGCTP